jgi:site-specific recombinase XerD
MDAAPIVTIYVRHSAGCKYEGDETARRCDCRKHLRWTQNGKRHRRKAETRSWAEAEKIKRQLEDQLAGRKPEATGSREIQSAIDVFVQDKKVQGVTGDVVKKYERLLGRLREHCRDRGVFAVQGISREVITGFCSTWEEQYPSSITRAKLRERLRSFLRYCYEAQWIERIPAVPKFKIDEPETQPLTGEEYERLLSSVRAAVAKGDPRRKTEANSGRRSPDEEEKQVVIVRAFLQCMRWTGLAIRDAVTLPRAAMTHDAARNIYRVQTKRAKTGTPVSVVVPPGVAKEMLAAHKLNSNPACFFWSGKGKPQSATSNWGQRYVAPVFAAAGIQSEGNMLSHRLRDTFAVHLLEHGTPMEEVSRLLGHESIRTTERHYAKWSKGRQERADELVMATWAVKTKAKRSSSTTTAVTAKA